MGKGDLYVKKMLQRPENFADLFNAKIFGGKQVIMPEDLTPVSNETGIVFMDKTGNKKVLQRRRDVIMKTTFGVYLSVLACEIQENIHYAMPVRDYLYDALDYMEQVQNLEHAHREKHELVTGGEYLSGIKKEDILMPVITMVFYYGRKAWDGSMSLYEMMGVKENDEVMEQLLKFVPDYRINLVNATDELDLERYKSDLHYVLGMLKYNKNKQELYQYARDNRNELKSMSSDATSAMLVMLGEQERVMKIMEQDTGFGEIETCQAIDELIEDGKLEGKVEGESKLVAVIRKKWDKGLKGTEIADILELDESYVGEVIAIMSEQPRLTDLEVAKKLVCR